MTKPLKRVAASLLLAHLILSGAALAASSAFGVNGHRGQIQTGENTPNPSLNPAKPKMWKVTVHSLGPNELGQTAIGPANCLGKPVTLHANITPAAGRKTQYAWTVNGQPQGGNTPEFTFTPNNVGTFTVQVTISDVTPPPPPMQRPKHFPVRCWNPPSPPPPPAPVTATTAITVSETPPIITSVTADPTTLACAANTTGAHTANLTVQATGSACGGNLSYKWTVSEGALTNDTSQNATFDAWTVRFEPGATAQSKAITATVTVTDETGKTASQSTSLAVTCPPVWQRLDDVIFAKNNARVNNCGKRILIDDAAPKMASGDYDIVLVGHRAADEQTNAPGRRRGALVPLDEQRTLNSAAVLSGGTGTCAQVDPSRIGIDWVGTDQTSESRPGICGTSAHPAQQERSGSQTSPADGDRRVEVYLVPKGTAAMPPAVKEIKPLPEAEIKALGCPK
jgi:hypothetical protein